VDDWFDHFDLTFIRFDTLSYHSEKEKKRPRARVERRRNYNDHSIEKNNDLANHHTVDHTDYLYAYRYSLCN
jgi:hypothetical protein